MFHNSNVLLTGGAVTYVAGNVIHPARPASGFELLCERVAAGALHNSGEVGDQPKCHPGTRVAILEHILTWATALTYTYPILWFHGPAGAGKSTILRTIAQMLFDGGLLLGSFFFLRSAAGRNTTDYFIATIAYQLALSVPTTRPHIEEALKKNPLLFSQSLWGQAQTLIVAPLILASQDPSFDSSRSPRVIVIDGLDECQDPDAQDNILQVLCRVLHNLPIAMSLLVASRPEHHIRCAFDSGDLNRFSSRMSLDNSYKSNADIKKYLVDRFNSIQNTHPLKSCLPLTPWPSPEIIDKLIRNASGQFIYASTVDKFVSSIRHNPAKRLDIVLGVIDAGTSKPFEQLDTLYSAIFLTVDPMDLDGALRVLGAFLVPDIEKSFGVVRTSRFVERLLDLEKGDIRRILFDLESLLSVGQDEEAVRFFHASLADYLFDRSRSGKFWIDSALIYADLAQHCIRHLPNSADWKDIQLYFMDNIAFFLSKATPTHGLREAIESCDLGTVASSFITYPNGVSYLCPIFLQAVTQKSAFPDPEKLFSSHLLTYERIVKSRIRPYFRGTNLKYFLITTVTTWMPEDWLAKGIFQLSESMVRTDSEEGFNLLDSDECPPSIPFMQKLFEDPKEACFVDGNQYADIALYLLKRMILDPGYELPRFPAIMPGHRAPLSKPLRLPPFPDVIKPGYRAPHPAPDPVDGQCISQIFPIILSKSSVRHDIVEYIKKTPLRPSYLEYTSIRNAILTYTSDKRSIKILHVPTIYSIQAFITGDSES